MVIELSGTRMITPFLWKQPLCLVVVNFCHHACASPGKSAALSSVSKTIEQVFPHQSEFAAEPGEEYNDFIFLACSRPIDLTSKALLPEQVAWLQNRAFSVNKAQAVVLTDNLNPLEHMQIEKSEHYRHVLVDWFGADLLVR